MQIRKSAVVFAVLVLVSAPALEAGEQPEPCNAEMKGALLLARMEQIGMTAGALRLLNGSEDPKLKRLLPFQLATAAVNARRHIDEGAKLEAGELTNIAEGVRRATAYLAEHDADREFLSVLGKHDATVFGPNGRRVDRPEENLAAVSEWLAKHQAGVRH
jgi:hypothetical protein